MAFVHVPRTGGSTAWRYLASLCADSHHVLDTYHEAQSRFGHERYALSAMSIFLSDVDRLPKTFLIHHHGIAPLNALLPKAKYLTLLRHPVDRLVSYYHHVRAQQALGVVTNEILADGLDVVAFYQRTPWHLDCYCSWFGGMMWQASGLYPRDHLLDALEPSPALLDAIRTDRDCFVKAAADYTVRKFAYIGFFDQISPSIKTMARQIGTSSDLPNIPHVNVLNGAERDDEAEKLKPLCSLDLEFYNLVRKAVGVWD